MAEKEQKVLKFIWKLENYSYCWNQKDDFLQSPDFELNIFEGSSWCLKLYPRGISCYEKYVSIRLERLVSSEGPLAITIDYEIAFLRPDGTATYIRKTKDRCFRKGRAFGFDNLAVREEILGTERSTLLPEDILTVQCLIFPKAKLESYTEIIAKTHIEIERSVFFYENMNLYEHGFTHKKLRFFNTKIDAILKFMNLDNLAICMNDHGSAVKVISGKIGILDSKDTISRVLMDIQYDDTWAKSHPTKSITFCTKDEILKKKSLYLPNDKLNLHCEFTFSYGVQHSKIEMISCDGAAAFVSGSIHTSEIGIPPKSYETDYDNSFKSIFYNLYREGTLCDFTLKVGDETIQAHRVVLGARSPVFKAMLMSNMTESDKNMVNILDLDANTVRCMLTFMYTDTAGDLDWETASKLYIAADKYEIMKLKHICSSFLEQNLCVSNVGEALSLASWHGDDYLKNRIQEFISRHDTEGTSSIE